MQCGDDTTDEVLAGWGVITPPKPKQTQTIWQCNLPVIELFLASLTQLRTSFGGVVGLDYTAVWLVAEVLAIKIDRVVLKGLNVCESELLELINSQSKQPK